MDSLLSISTLSLTILSIVIIFVYALYRLHTRRHIELGEIQYIDIDPQQISSDIEVLSLINKKIELIAQIHQRGDHLHAEGEADYISQVQPTNEAIETTVSLLGDLSNVPLIGFAFRLLDLISPRILLEGEVQGREAELILTARLKRGSETLESIIIEVERGEPGAIDELVTELAYQLIVKSGTNGQLKQQAKLGTKSWQAFRLLTEALEIIHTERSLYSLEQIDMAGHVVEMLQQAIEYDPQYALAYYNKGAVLYNIYVGVEDNVRALKYFECAISILEDLPAGEQNKDLLMMAFVGQSRSYSQLVHRFGRDDASYSVRAREAARQALAIRPESPVALYAMGFAWHCTEVLEDIEAGAECYDQIICRYPRTYAVVHNNYGYILLEKAKLLRDKGDPGNAEKALGHAIEQLNQALQSDPSPRVKDFAYSNRGKANRLLGKYEAAIADAQRALQFREAKSRYTGGLQDLAETHIAAGNYLEALEAHGAALRSTSDAKHRQNLAKRTVSELEVKGVGTLSHPISLNTDGDIDDWIDHLRATILV